MEREEFDKFLKDIGGLENSYFPDKPSIKSSYFFDIAKGWYPLVKELIEKLIEAGWDKKICQVKEKFGGLRFYTGGLTDEQRKIVNNYEAKSYKTCEQCGKLGKPRNDGWVTTLCDEHYKKRNDG